MLHSNAHPKTPTPSDKDLREDPGIGASKGTAKAGDDDIEDGDNTFQGDVENDVGDGGKVDPARVGRTNK